MARYAKSSRLARGRFYNHFWMSIFFLGVLVALSALYYATLKVDYVWRWYRIPQYFYYQEKVEVRAYTRGEVAEIILKGDEAILLVVGEGERGEYRLPAEALHAEKGDAVYPGDVLGAYREPRVGILLIGLWMTLKVSLIAIFAGILIGLAAGLCRISSNPALKWAAIAYIELIRGSPLLVQIFIWYFVLGTLFNTLLAQAGFSQLSPIWYGVTSLAFFAGAYVAEIVRAGIQSIHRGQMEAARSLGMSYSQAMKHIVLPQALRRILPPLAGQFISLIKDSSLLGLIAIRELTKATREVVTTSLQPFELWFTCALLYLILTFSLSMFVQYLERRAVLS